VNFEEKFYGPTPLRTALAHSRNIVTVKLLQEIGVRQGIEMAQNLGIGTPLENNLSIALGSSGVTLFDLTSAYSTFANQGKRINPIGIRYIQNRDGETVFTPTPEITEPLTPGVAYTITSLLQSVVQEGTATKVKDLGRPIAGKTGTTNDFVDAWFLGYTPNIVTGVWVGKDQDESLGVNETGSRAAIPIWLDFMKRALKDTPILGFPESDHVVFAKVDPETGEEPSAFNPDAEFEVFPLSHFPDMARPVNPAAQNTF